MTTKITITTIGKDAGRGNLIGIQPEMETLDYASVERFSDKLESYLQEAQSHNLLNAKTIVVFPEYIGTWLVAGNLPQWIYRLNRLSLGMMWIIISHLWQFFRHFLIDRNSATTIFRIRASQMSRDYHTVFSSLAKKYGVSIVAGSIVLPDPCIKHGELHVSDGPLYNASMIYRPDGTPYDTVIHKVNLTQEERPFTAAGTLDQLPVFSTPTGKLAILICADSWYKECYRQVDLLGAEIVVVPSFLTPSNIWNKPWHSDRSITEKEAWLRNALPGQIAKTNIKHGLNVFLRGNLWNLGSSGQTLASFNHTAHIADIDSTIITCLWLP